MNTNPASEIQPQIGLWSILLVCERLFFIYCKYSGKEKQELRELLDELWTVDLENETYTEDEVSNIQSFIGSLYPKSGSGNEHTASGFIVSLVDIYDYIVSRDNIYIKSIKEQGIDSIRHHLECLLFKDEESPREISDREREEIENSMIIKKEIFSQINFDKEIQGNKIDSIKSNYIYDPIA